MGGGRKASRDPYLLTNKHFMPITVAYIRDISEEECPARRMDFDIIQRIKLSPEEVIEQHRGIVRRLRVDKRDRGRQRPAPRRDEKQGTLVRPRAPVRHLDRVGKNELDRDVSECPSIGVPAPVSSSRSTPE